jgi:ATP-dependent DNA ligase
MEKVLSYKGEGMMLKDPDSIYERKRSKYLLKIK